MLTRLLPLRVDTVSIDYDNTFDLPMGFGTGFVYDISDSWTVGVDYKYQKWSDVRYFNETPFSDRHRVAAGFEFLPNKMSKSYFKRISYLGWFELLQFLFQGE